MKCPCGVVLSVPILSCFFYGMIFFSPEVCVDVCMCLLNHLRKFLLLSESDLVLNQGDSSREGLDLDEGFLALLNSQCLCWPLALLTQTVIENNWSRRNLCLNVFFQRNEILADDFQILCMPNRNIYMDSNLSHKFANT